MPSSANAIADVIAGGPTRSIHVGTANGRRFVMMAGVGFDAHVVSRINPKMKRALGKLAYVLETLLALLRFPFPTYRVVLDGRAFEAASLVVANGHYYGGRFVCAPDARLDDGWFDVCLFGRAGAWYALRYAAALVLGRLQTLRDVVVIRARTVIVLGDDAEPVQGDGDIVAHLPLEVVAGERIGVVVPA